MNTRRESKPFSMQEED